MPVIPSDPYVPKFLSPEICRSVVTEFHAYDPAKRIALLTQWQGDTRWTRNRVYAARDWRDNAIGPMVNLDPKFGGPGGVTNQFDSTSLQAVVALNQVDHQAFPDASMVQPSDIVWAVPEQPYPATHIWSERTYTQPPDERETIAVQLVAGAERAGMLSSGYLRVEARGYTVRTEDGRLLYAPQTLAQCSMTVRDPQGSGSGWAGASSYDWYRIDAAKLAEIALEKCLTSRNPVRIEPGRYTLILEPQATFGLMEVLMRMHDPGTFNQFMERAFAEGGTSPFSTHRQTSYQLKNGTTVQFDPTRVGERVLDERLTITFDPLDPDLGVLPFVTDDTKGVGDDGEPVVPVTWVERGVLTALSYDRSYAMERLQQASGQPNTQAFRVHGGTDTVADMIATTKRGLLVTRFWDVRVLDGQSLLSTGMTRDGLWLIEDGQITHPVQNLRFTESLLSAFNQVEQLGGAVLVFSPAIPAIAPAMKVRDFNFTSLVDAI